MAWAYSLYRRSRAQIAWLSDRVAEGADRRLLGLLGASPALSRVATPAVTAIGRLAAWSRLPPRMSVRTVTSANATVVVCGEGEGTAGLDEVLDLNAVTVQPRHRHLTILGGRTLASAVPQRGWLVAALPAGAHLVRALPRTAYQVDVLSSVGHIVDLSRPFTLEGGERKGLRRSLARLDEHQLATVLTRSRDAFVEFHERFYRPHLEERHRNHAVVVARDRQWAQWIARGGSLLQLLVDGEVAVCGIVFRHGHCVTLVEEGVNHALESEPYFGALQAALKREAIAWARSNGAAHAYLGLSPAAAAHGIYRSKRLWGARPIVPPRVMLPRLAFRANTLSDADRHLVNARRLVAIARGRPAVVRVLREDAAFEGPGRTDAELVLDGFDGVIEVMPHRSTYRALSPPPGA